MLMHLGKAQEDGSRKDFSQPATRATLVQDIDQDGPLCGHSPEHVSADSICA
jgi:hypothetical protein